MQIICMSSQPSNYYTNLIYPEVLTLHLLTLHFGRKRKPSHKPNTSNGTAFVYPESDFQSLFTWENPSNNKWLVVRCISMRYWKRPFMTYCSRGFIRRRLPAVYRRLCCHQFASHRRLLWPDFHSNPYSDRRLL